MTFSKEYGFFSVSKENTYKGNKEFTVSGRSFGRKLDLLCLKYTGKKTHGKAWKTNRFAKALFASIFTLGLSNLSYSFRLLWKEATSGREMHAVFMRVTSDSKPPGKEGADKVMKSYKTAKKKAIKNKEIDNPFRTTKIRPTKTPKGHWEV